ncbi:phosducin-like protein [Dendronephthya gigantea]|uniref:phosducin-like protein n=1 Tax=Dendronephthya gigantea TaxID=151771 RepID=UPI00106CF35A|nr:phosducin-like protein [Dendronephthya gigantea]
MDLEDKLLGYKAQNYVSSSESEGEDDEDSGRESGGEVGSQNAEEAPQLDLRVDGPMTGPKGVIEDYRRYRQLVAEQREEKKAELEALAKKFSITCQSSLDEEKEKNAKKEFEFDEEDEFVKMYHMKRLQEMRKRAEEYVSSIRPQFGSLKDIPGKEFLDCIDKENPNIVIVMHLYQPGVEGCSAMTGCLKVLSQQYPRVKFCQVPATETGISKYFVQNGLPALLVYQNKQLIGNYVKMNAVFGDDFYATDVESFLIENGILSENTPDMVTKLRSNEEDSDDSD